MEKEIKTEPIKNCNGDDDNEMEIEKINCEDLENKFLLVRVGDADSPATTEDINEITEKLEKMFKVNGINCLTFVTHHAVTVNIIEKQGI